MWWKCHWTLVVDGMDEDEKGQDRLLSTPVVRVKSRSSLLQEGRREVGQLRVAVVLQGSWSSGAMTHMLQNRLEE